MVSIGYKTPWNYSICIKKNGYTCEHGCKFFFYKIQNKTPGLQHVIFIVRVMFNHDLSFVITQHEEKKNE